MTAVGSGAEGVGVLGYRMSMECIVGFSRGSEPMSVYYGKGYIRSAYPIIGSPAMAVCTLKRWRTP